MQSSKGLCKTHAGRRSARTHALRLVPFSLMASGTLTGANGVERVLSHWWRNTTAARAHRYSVHACSQGGGLSGFERLNGLSRFRRLSGLNEPIRTDHIKYIYKIVSMVQR
jgi:hypothetical protein